MFSPTDTVKLLLVIAFLHYCNSTDCASSCGNIKINYPFRLKTDPPHCGHKNYELACQDDAVIVHMKVTLTEPAQAVEYPVRAINYENFTIRLVDPNIHIDDCALHTITILPVDGFQIFRDPASFYVSSEGYTRLQIIQPLRFISCPYPVSGSLYVHSSPCNKRYWYLNFGTYGPYAYQLENGCRIEAISMTSLPLDPLKNISYKDIVDVVAYGFDLSWDLACCTLEATRKLYSCREVYCSAGDTENGKRFKMTKDFDKLFSFFYKLKDRSVFSGIFAYLEKIFGGQYIYDKYDDLTVFGLVIHFLLAIIISSKVLSCFLGSICVTIFLIYKWRKRHLSAYDNIEEFLQSYQNYLMPVRYSYSEIKKISRGFKEKLGEGGYGSVYKGKLRSGSFVAIKMLNKPKASGQEFINEVVTIGRIHHVNVVQLIGFCVDGSKRALVYEFMSNGSLDKHIFSKEGCIPLCNKMIFDVCLGVAHGIQYLHHGCDMQILHFDIKPHNILLDEKFIPKISDFGLAKLHSTDHSIASLTAARGTIGYIAPEFFYRNIGGISYKADVYSFGMLLMEMVGRRKNINAFTEHSSRIYFPSWIYDQLNKGKDVKLKDETLEGSNIVKKMIMVALWCIQLNPIDRPSMCKIIEMLEGEVEHLKMPPKPFVTPQETPINDVGLYTNIQTSTANASDDHSDAISLLVDSH